MCLPFTPNQQVEVMDLNGRWTSGWVYNSKAKRPDTLNVKRRYGGMATPDRRDVQVCRRVPVHRVRRATEEDCPLPDGKVGETDSEGHGDSSAAGSDNDQVLSMVTDTATPSVRLLLSQARTLF